MNGSRSSSKRPPLELHRTSELGGHCSGPEISNRSLCLDGCSIDLPGDRNYERRLGFCTRRTARRPLPSAKADRSPRIGQVEYRMEIVEIRFAGLTKYWYVRCRNQERGSHSRLGLFSRESRGRGTAHCFAHGSRKNRPEHFRSSTNLYNLLFDWPACPVANNHQNPRKRPAERELRTPSGCELRKLQG